MQVSSSAALRSYSRAELETWKLRPPALGACKKHTHSGPQCPPSGNIRCNTVIKYLLYILIQYHIPAARLKNSLGQEFQREDQTQEGENFRWALPVAMRQYICGHVSLYMWPCVNIYVAMCQYKMWPCANIYVAMRQYICDHA